MKKIFLPLLFVIFSEDSNAQSVIIDPNAVGNIINAKSTTKGMLIPQLTTAQKLAIVNPTEGTMVYDLDAKQFSYCLTPTPNSILSSCNWVNFGNSQIPPTYWSPSGNNLYNTTGGNVGIGNVSPTTKLDVNGGIRAKGLFMPIKTIPIGVDYTIEDGDYTIIADANFTCFPAFSITLPNPSLNEGRIINVILINTTICTSSLTATVSFKNHLGNHINNFGFGLYDYYNEVSLKFSTRTKLTLQGISTYEPGWVTTSDNYYEKQN